MPTDAKQFYGEAYNDKRAPFLEKACRFLDMALRAEEGDNKQNMAFNAALKAEGEAFA